MKVVILAGGFGTRINEESCLLPKPMIEIGEKPILWHIMKYFSAFGHHEFVVCCGYRQYVIKEFFADYYLHTSDVTFDFGAENKMLVHNTQSEPWKVTLIDTGLHTMTGGRIRRAQPYLNGDPFFLTYGDGVSDVNLEELLSWHRQQGCLATLTAVQPEGRFGAIDIQEDNRICHFREKHREDGGWINGGFMVLQPEVMDYIAGDATVFEQAPLETLASEGQLRAYKHKGFWQCMDTLRDKQQLEKRWAANQAPWKIW